jgi:hypothetical protein
LVTKVLGRVLALDAERGPDVLHRVRVAAEWLTNGEAIELRLPRHLTCAVCEGGGCDICDRSGAITLRGRDEAPEMVRVTLPQRGAHDPPVLLRIPEFGGLAPMGSSLSRGALLLKVVAASATDSGVRRVEDSDLPTAVSEAPSPRSGVRRRSRSVSMVAVAVVLLIVVLILLRVLGIA